MSEEKCTTRFWPGLACAAVLLMLGLILLGGQAAVTAGPPPEPAGAIPAIVDPHVLLEKYAGYYGAAGVVVTQVTSLFYDQDEAWTEYQAGNLDTITPPDSALATIKASGTYGPQLHDFPRAYTYVYAMSGDVPPCNNPLLRAALASAIDRQGLIDDVLNGDEEPALTLTPPRHFGHIDGYAENIGWPYNPTVANSLLTQSGYTGSPAITLMVNTYPYHQSIANKVAQMWQDTLGITAVVSDMEWSSYMDLLRNGSATERPCVFRLGWMSDYPDAHSWHSDYWKSTVAPLARNSNPAYDALLDAAAAETNAADRLALYKQAETLLVETDAAVLPLFYGVQFRLARPDLVRSYYTMGGQQVKEWSFTGAGRPLELAWGRPSTLDPATSGSVDYIEQLFLALTGYDETTGNVVPELATGWVSNDDASVYTFTLRSNATWTDGKTVKASDVEYGILRSLNPATGAGLAYELFDIANAWEYYDGQISEPSLVGVEALDNTHIRFDLARPAAYFPSKLATPPACAQPKWAIDAHGLAWTDPATIVTNGPYKLMHWDQAPYLRVGQNVEGQPLTGNTLTVGVGYDNLGGDPAEGCVITGTLGGLSFVSEDSGLPRTGSGTDADPYVWQAGTCAAYSSDDFQIHVEVTAGYGEEVSSRLQIGSTDANDQGADWEQDNTWSQSVEGPFMYVNYGENRAGGAYPVGHTFAVTLTDSADTIKATASDSTSPDGGGYDGAWWDGFEVMSHEWTPDEPGIQPGDRVYFGSDDGYHNMVVVGTITGRVNPADDSIRGTINAPGFTDPLEVVGGAWGFDWQSTTADPGGGSYAVYLNADALGGMPLSVAYIEPDGDRVYNTFDVPWLGHLPVVLKAVQP